ncbi:hypothetical protein OAU50_01435 [Planctomycetota bacterium]|nr:hypothetical protein [Planctomycetota bacterium]
MKTIPLLAAFALAVSACVREPVPPPEASKKKVPAEVAKLTLENELKPDVGADYLKDIDGLYLVGDEPFLPRYFIRTPKLLDKDVAWEDLSSSEQRHFWQWLHPFLPYHPDDFDWSYNPELRGLDREWPRASRDNRTSRYIMSTGIIPAQVWRDFLDACERVARAER